jgi:hypothetical protein
MSDKSNTVLLERIREIRQEILAIQDPQMLALRTGCLYQVSQSGTSLEFSFFEQKIRLSYPTLVAREFQENTELPILTQTLIFYYLLTANGNPIQNRWISFSELPDGKVYEKAFQGYTGDEIVRQFGNELNLFQKANQLINGDFQTMGNASYRYLALPKIPLAVVYHVGDEEFLSSCKFLFDASVKDYLPTEACAILGSLLVRRILQSTISKTGTG